MKGFKIEHRFDNALYWTMVLLSNMIEAFIEAFNLLNLNPQVPDSSPKP